MGAKDSVWDQDLVWRIPSVRPWVALTQKAVPETTDLESNSLQELMIYIKRGQSLNSLQPWFSCER